MISEVFVQHPWLWPLAWQSTICLAAGLAGSILLRRRPARAHQLLLLSLIAAMLIPTLSHTVRQNQWGLFVAERTVAIRETQPFIAPPDLATATPTPMSNAAAEPSRPTAIPGMPVPAGGSFQWGSALPLLWLAVTSALLLRLIARLLLGLRLVRRSEAVESGLIAEALDAAKAKLGIEGDVLVRGSNHAQSPVIWCWGRPPVLLVPGGSCDDTRLDWSSIVCHELAHWRRRDHISGLLAELMICLLPWQLFSWLARRRLVDLSEEACDDWVIASGQVGTRYARTLLNLTPLGQAALVPAVVTTRTGLAGRIRRILTNQCSNPRSGLRWTLTVAALTACISVGLAFAQTHPARQTPSESAQSPASWAKLNEILDAMLRHDTDVMPIALHADMDLYRAEGTQDWQHEETYSFEQRLDARRLDSIMKRYRIEDGKPIHTQNARRIFTGAQYLYFQQEIGLLDQDHGLVSVDPPEEAKRIMAHHLLWGSVLLGYLDGDQKPVAAILKDSPATILHDLMEKVDGFACYVIESSTDHGRYQLWVDPQHDWRIRRATVHKGPGDIRFGSPMPDAVPTDNRMTVRVHKEISGVRLERIAGRFIPVAETEAGTYMDGDGTERRTKVVVTRSAVDLSPDFGKLGAFVMDAVPEGTHLVVFDPNDHNFGYELHGGKAVPMAPDGPTIAVRVKFTGYDSPDKVFTRRRAFNVSLRPVGTPERSDGLDMYRRTMSLKKDGSFRIEQVPAGKHRLRLEVFESEDRGTFRTIAAADREVSIPEAGNQPQEKVIDLGVIEMAIEQKGETRRG
jgi:beta-lactamase regulating signal transducer with metallopeptidase domain